MCHYLAGRLRTHLAYDPAEGQSFEPSSVGDWLPVPEDELRLRLWELITMAHVDAPEAKARLSDEWLSRVCRRLKSSLATPLPLAEGRLCVFLDQILARAGRERNERRIDRVVREPLPANRSTAAVAKAVQGVGRANSAR
jgi:hypothetical protein